MPFGVQRGSAVIDALAALTLVAAAGAVVAAAAATSLRAVRRAAMTTSMTAVAARELATLQACGAPEGAAETELDDPELGSGAHRRTLVVHRPDGIVELSVTITATSASSPVTLATRMLAPE